MLVSMWMVAFNKTPSLVDLSPDGDVYDFHLVYHSIEHIDHQSQWYSLCNY